ncbi:MAG: M14 family zinc carboxypeptidase [Bacteroidetes bacterium]|nr:M14 family zinc carboxypeptidase [Bacteroidota bacterium]
MKNILFLTLIFCTKAFAGMQGTPDLRTPHEKTKGNYTATFQETLAYYQLLEKTFPEVKLTDSFGQSDNGTKLPLAIISTSKNFNIKELKTSGKLVLMINNAIHAGEPEGVDATMMFVRDILTKNDYKKLLDNVVILIIPTYNIDGVMNRGCCSRANQNGPQEYGFRGNAKNLDLNRDFIKSDSKNAQTFNRIFSAWEPDVFIDNHVSDGADYQYTLTYISNELSLDVNLNTYMRDELTPAINKLTTKDGFEMCPYVETKANIPDSGLVSGHAPSRFSSGYAALFNCISYTVETHMLKPFDKRLQSNYSFMLALLINLHKDAAHILTQRSIAISSLMYAKEHVITWAEDSLSYDWINFKGYEAAYKPSIISGLPRLYYNHEKPYNKRIKYYNYVTPGIFVKVPKAYIIPCAWSGVIDRLKNNGVWMTPLIHDSIIEVEVYTITNYENARNNKPYEGHYLHQKVTLSTEKKSLKFLKGDWLINTDQRRMRYLMETLEPQAPDAFFAWNFFDAVLQQKEYFSDYVWEDVAADILEKNPALKKELETKKLADPTFAKSAQMQLDFVYKNSPYFEKTVNRYPVYRVVR